MTLDGISGWFQSIGIHPIIGAFAIGVFLGFFLFRKKKSDMAQVSSYSAARPTSSLQGNLQSTSSKNPSMSLEVLSRARERIAEGNIIEAIKEIRHATGVGLTEAKSIVEELKRGGGF